MSARHFLRHLALAYHHFHTIDEHFAKHLGIIEKKRLKAEIASMLTRMETRCAVALSENRSDDLYRLLYKIKALRSKLVHH